MINNMDRYQLYCIKRLMIVCTPGTVSIHTAFLWQKIRM